MRVIASSIRKGNIIEREDGQLCIVLSAESFHPGKGTPTTQIDMRRLSDGVKVTDRYKTTEHVERAFVEDKNFDFLYADAGYHFMNADTYDQIQVPADVIGDQAQWLQEGMKVTLSIFNSIPVAIQLPPRVKQVHVLKKFYKRFTGKFFGFMLVVGIPVADFHGITIQPLV